MAKAGKSSKSTPGIPLDEAIKEVSTLLDDATEFRVSELEEHWLLAERYYQGETDLENFEGRSTVTKTEVRDAIRNIMPSIMRTLLHSRKPVMYHPSSVEHSQWVEQQAEYVTQLFAKNNGYQVLHSAVLEALKLRLGAIKAFWEPDPTPEYFKYTNVPFTLIEQMANDPLIEIEDFERFEQPTEAMEDVITYNVKGYRYYENGKIVIEDVPNYEFFISRNCYSIEQALRQGVHGHQRIVTVSEALDMGLDYDGDWLELDDDDPETNDHTTSSAERKGYQKTSPNEVASTDVLRHKFLLTEAYVQYDLEDKGRPQTYVFYLGGSSHKYIHHEKVEDSPFATLKPIPIPGSAYGHSIADLTINEQDTSTSLLRAAIDNAHAANDAKIAADPSKTNFDDIMNPAINAPIRKRSGDTLQMIQVPFTGQGNLAMLQYLDQDVQNKVGITKAAQGLDPDAMQSTDKQAVLNTIATSQGQVELMVRNIIETGLIRLFRIILKLSIRHMSPMQLMMTKGTVIPVDTRMFDPDAAAEPNVGLGTASPIQKQAALTMILQRQEMYMDKLGPNNPFVTYAQIYNTLEDLLEANNIPNVHRYFNVVTPQVEAQWAKAQAEQQKALMEQQQANQPMDPSKAYMQIEAEKRKIEQLKALLDQRDKERERSLDALTKAEDLDIQRDKLIQDRVIQLAKIQAQAENKAIKEEQAANERISAPSEGSSETFVSKRGHEDATRVSSSNSANRRNGQRGTQ